MERERPYIRLRIRRSSRSSLRHDAPLQAPARACGATSNTLSLQPANVSDGPSSRRGERCSGHPRPSWLPCNGSSAITDALVRSLFHQRFVRLSQHTFARRTTLRSPSLLRLPDIPLWKHAAVARCQTAVTVRPNSKVSPGPKKRGNQSNAPHKRGLLLQGRDPPVPPRCITPLRPQT